MKIKPLLRGPIALRLFIFNALLLFVPVAGFLSFEAYEKALLSNLEHSLVQEGRALAAWLGESSVDEERAQRIIASLQQRHTSRIRVLSKEGILLADSSAANTANEALSQNDEEIISLAAASSAESSEEQISPEETFLYQLLTLPVRIYRNLIPPSPIQAADYYSGKNQFDGQEIEAALEGRYGSTIRVSSGGQTSITLYSALPIFLNNEVEGAVLVSQSTYRILNDLYALRLGVGRVFLYSLLIAIIVSFIMALTISRPLSRLTNEAKQIRKKAHHDYSSKPFSGSNRNDEIDTLAKAFSSLVQKLEQRIHWAEHFSADAAHELKNPLAGIKANAELLETSDAVQQGIVTSIENACDRMEKTISGLRMLALFERSNGTSTAEELGNAIQDEVRRYDSPFVLFENLASENIHYAKMILHVQIQNLETAARNLLQNAHSFSPKDKPVKVAMVIHGENIELHVQDCGGGVPEDLREKIFERFYTSRRGNSSGEHSGLGLAIVRAIAESGGGTVSVKNADQGAGAHFVFSLPYTIIP